MHGQPVAHTPARTSLRVMPMQHSAQLDDFIETGINNTNYMTHNLYDNVHSHAILKSRTNTTSLINLPYTN